MKAELVPENGDPPIPITRDLVVIGRRDYCDVVIDHSSLSKRHCLVVKTDGLLVIRDLISTNGTKVKGQKIRWAALLPDDRITLGSYKLRVYYGPDDVPGPSELYRSKSRRGASVAVPALTRASSPAAAPDKSLKQGFPEPSPLEILVSSSEEDLIALPPARPNDDEPLIPIILDDSDEIIDLD
jgi:pSer/pThr/pTyr-binding forkhead associated (FHA) protein